MRTPGFEQWGEMRVEDSKGRVGVLTYGKDDMGRKEGYQLWTFTPDGAAPEVMMMNKLWSGEPKHERRPNANSPWSTLKSIGGHLFTYKTLPP